MICNFSVKPDIKDIELLKENIIRNIKSSDSHLLHQIEMTFSELLENAVKYSDKCVNKDIEIYFEYNDHIKISISNYVENESNLNVIKDIIKKIKSISKKDNLYHKRIKEIIERKKHGESQMGLYRIFYEGDFNLDYYFDHSNKKLSIIATR